MSGTPDRLGLPPTPEILYHPFFSADDIVPYKIGINSYVCGQLMRSVGHKDTRIPHLKVLVTPENPPNPEAVNRTASYDPEQRAIYLSPTSTWNKQQELLGRARLQREPQANVRRIDVIFPLVGIEEGTITRDTEGYEDGEEGLRQRLDNFMGKKERTRFFKCLNQEEDFKGATKILTEGSRRALTESLAYGIYLSAHPINRLDSVQRTVSSLGPTLLTFLALYSERYIADNPFWYALIATNTVFALREACNEFLPSLVEMLNVQKFKAGRFAKEISNNPKWDNLITLERGWN